MNCRNVAQQLGCFFIATLFSTTAFSIDSAAT
ncbi:Uncharacterised protein [Lelliottia amnigena]|nr:Uncharacterised protein [Lelliottia amnigena]